MYLRSYGVSRYSWFESLTVQDLSHDSFGRNGRSGILAAFISTDERAIRLKNFEFKPEQLSETVYRDISDFRQYGEREVLRKPAHLSCISELLRSLSYPALSFILSNDICEGCFS